jgi:hypothetical protein
VNQNKTFDMTTLDCDRLSTRERRLVVGAVAIIWILFALAIAIIPWREQLSWETLSRPLEDPRQWKVETTDLHTLHHTERPATAYDMIEQRYGWLVGALLMAVWVTASVIMLRQGLRRKRTVLTRWALYAMGDEPAVTGTPHPGQAPGA